MRDWQQSPAAQQKTEGRGFIPNSENEERVSPAVSGEEDSNAVLGPLLLLQDATKAK